MPEKNIKVWFGEITPNGDVIKGEDLKSDFLNCQNIALDIEINLPKIGSKVFGSETEYYSELRRTAIRAGNEMVEKELRRDDKYAIMLLKAMDQLDESINLLSEKLRDIVILRESDVTEDLQNKIIDLKNLRTEIEKEITNVTSKLAPNLSELAGPVIVSRLLERTGSLERLAMLPSSVIQILGAEKSLFRAKAREKKGKPAKYPKHGVIFQHQYIKTLPPKKRGKMARLMASKLAIAAKIDLYRGELNPELEENVRKRYEELLRN